MAHSCPYCGATINFGLKFCVNCGRQTVQALNKMGALRVSTKYGELKKGAGEGQSGPGGGKRKSLRFRQGIRSFSQTVFYGFLAGALFFCAILFTLEAFFPGQVNRLVAPILGPFLRSHSQDGDLDKAETAEPAPAQS